MATTTHGAQLRLRSLETVVPLLALAVVGAQRLADLAWGCIWRATHAPPLEAENGGLRSETEIEFETNFGSLVGKAR